MTRGELWTVAGGVYASKPRPALVLQDDLFDRTGSLTVLPLTTTPSEPSLLRIPIAADALSGLSRDSEVMIDKITSVRRTHLGALIGRVSTEQLLDVERSVMVFLGLAR